MIKRYTWPFGWVTFKMLSLALLGVLIALASTPTVWGAEIAWVRQFGSANGDKAYAVDVEDNVYVAGVASGAWPGQPWAGTNDAFVRKYDANGNELWTRQFGTTSSDDVRGIAADASGVYVVGYTVGTFPGQTSPGGGDAFIRKYDADGNELWTRQFGTTASDIAAGISADASGVYVAGLTSGTFPGQIRVGDWDGFVRKYDASGIEVWTRQFGTVGLDEVQAISADASGIYLAGYTSGVFPGQPWGGSRDAFVVKYAASGTALWARQFGTTGAEEARGIAADASGVYVAGLTSGTFPGQIRVGDWDGFVRKYDAGGTGVWTRQFGTVGRDEVHAVSADASGIYVAGYTLGAFPGYINAGSSDAFARKYAADGIEVWTRQFGTPAGDEANGVSVAPTGIYVVGYTVGTFPGQPAARSADAFVAKFANSPPVVNAGGPSTGAEGTAVPLAGTASDSDGDPLLVSWSYMAASSVDAGTKCEFADASALKTTLTCTDDGTYTATLTVSDGVNPPVSASTTITLDNLAPALTFAAPAAGTLSAVNTAVDLTVTFTDAGANDTHNGPSGGSCRIDWADGTIEDGRVTEPNGSNPGTCDSSHTYNSIGVYTVQATLTDDDGAAAAQSMLVVVYEPGAGFVAGNGWIDSPAGAYQKDPPLSGRADFGFVSKYHQGAGTPTGQTQFQFRFADLDFRSQAYDLLDVAGERAQYYGTGTINGVGNYGFMLIAIDSGPVGVGGADKFRMKIWDKDNGDALVYDSQLGAEDTAEPSIIAGGSIVIYSQ
ncbi:MAG: PKD domain-containing protein [Roseiflexaceae bacterium]